MPLKQPLKQALMVHLSETVFSCGINETFDGLLSIYSSMVVCVCGIESK